MLAQFYSRANLKTNIITKVILECHKPSDPIGIKQTKITIAMTLLHGFFVEGRKIFAFPRRFSPPVKYSLSRDRSKAVPLLWIIYVISVLFLLCFRVCLFIDDLWSPARKEVTSWLLFVMS